MTSYRVACFVVVPILVAATLASMADDGRRSALNPTVERERIQTHLRGAERLLEAADVSHLTDAQRERRAHVLTLLRDYRRAGVFPHNHDFPGKRVPYFVDRHGTLCAMAYLIARTGGGDLVARVARTVNNAYVPDLAADPAFRDWLDRHGMTVAEAARVQPWYDCCFDEPADPDLDYAVATAGNAVLGGAAIALQLVDPDAPDGWRTILGIGAGGIGIGLGAAALDETGGNASLAAINIGLGAAALGTTAWRLLRGGEEPAATTEAGREDRRSWSARPAFSPASGAGVNVAIRF